MLLWIDFLFSSRSERLAVNWEEEHVCTDEYGQFKHFKAFMFVKMSDSTENEYFTSPGAKQLWGYLTKYAFRHVYFLPKLCFEYYTIWPKVFGHILFAFNMSSKGLHCFKIPFCQIETKIPKYSLFSQILRR